MNSTKAAQAITGQFFKSDGSTAAGATLAIWWADGELTVQLDAEGRVPAGVQIEAAEEYSVSIFDAKIHERLYRAEGVRFPDGDLDLNAALPLLNPKLTTLTGTFKRPDGTEPGLGTFLRLKLVVEEDSPMNLPEVTTGAIVGGERIPLGEEVTIPLTRGVVPPEVRILANSDIPFPTHYRVEVQDHDRKGFDTKIFNGQVTISSGAPVADITPVEEEVYTPPVPKLRAATSRKNGSPATNYLGFWPVTITCPSKVGSGKVPSLAGDRHFAVCGFHLNDRSVIASAAAIIDDPARGEGGRKNELLLALYDATGKRVWHAALDAQTRDVSNVAFDVLTLPPADYYFGWALRLASLDMSVKTISDDLGCAEQMRVANAGGGNAVAGLVAHTGCDLPATFDPAKIVTSNSFGRDSTYNVPLVYLKA